MAKGLTRWTGPVGEEANPAGVAQYFYAAVVTDFDSIADITRTYAAATDNADLVNISADHTFPIDKGFHKIYITQGTGKISHNQSGGVDGMSAINKFECFLPGDEDIVNAIIRLLQNNSLIILVPLLDGKFRQVGSELVYAKMVSYEGDSGDLKGSTVRGTKITIEDVDQYIKQYSGVITEATVA